MKHKLPNKTIHQNRRPVLKHCTNRSGIMGGRRCVFTKCDGNGANMEYRSNLERWPRGSGSSGGETPAPQIEGRALVWAILFAA